MTLSLLLWNDKSAHAPAPSKNSDAGAVPFTMKCEPIIDLSTTRTYGYEVLTHLPDGINSEEYFSLLSFQHQLNLFYQQLAKIKLLSLRRYYSLNLPMRALIDWPLIHAAISASPAGLIIEIQDPNTFFALSSDQRQAVFEVVCRLEALNIPVWLDDVTEKLITAFIAAKWHLSGIKLDKNTFWALSKTPDKLHHLIRMGRAVANLVIIEGIETEEHKAIALGAGADLGQGYLWPALYPDNA